MSDQGPTHDKTRVLIVEDDEAMAVALTDGFTSEGYQVTLVREGHGALTRAREDKPDLIILDLMLPGLNGFEICQRLRGEDNPVPIIMLTARGQEVDKVLGLKLGADDYVTKPFSFLELVARVEAIMRRAKGEGAHAAASPQGCKFGDVEVDFQRHRASKAGEEIELTPREFRILEFFLRHQGEVVTRDQLLNQVWGYQAIPYTRTVDAHIAKLRKKVEDNPEEPRFILTVHRLGYKFLLNPR